MKKLGIIGLGHMGMAIAKGAAASIGAGEIAVPVLRELSAAEEIQLCGIVTQPDRPAGRKNHLAATPLGAFADASGLTAERVSDVNAPEFIAKLLSISPDLVLVVSFGQLLKPELLALPRCGCLNLHASLLPRYRGASPIVQSLLNRDAETGVDLMRMEAGLDTGAVYRTWKYPLNGSEYADKLEIALGELAAANLVPALQEVVSSRLVPVPQDEEAATFCRKIKKRDGDIDWNAPAERIEAMVRAYRPWPGAVMKLISSRGEQTATILKAKTMAGPTEGPPGRVLDVGNRRLIVSCGSGALEIEQLQPSGGKAMTAAAFLNGLRGELPQVKITDLNN